MGSNGMSKHDHILAGLVFSLQAAAMQQLGKIQNPMTGEIEKDLEQAKGTIDILEMLKVKCRTDTPEDLLRMVDGAVMDLQLNYMDEMKKEASSGQGDEGEDQEAAPEGAKEGAKEEAKEEAPEEPRDKAGDEADG